MFWRWHSRRFGGWSSGGGDHRSPRSNFGRFLDGHPQDHPQKSTSASTHSNVLTGCRHRHATTNHETSFSNEFSWSFHVFCRPEARRQVKLPCFIPSLE